MERSLINGGRGSKKSRKKLMGKCKEIEQKRKGFKSFEMTFSVIFSCYGKNLICKKETGH